KRAEKRDLVAGAGEQRFHQLQVAYRDRVQHQVFLAVIKADAVHVFERSALGGADVVQDGSRRRSRGRLALQPEAFQRDHAQLVLEQRYGIVRGEHPVLERSLGEAQALGVLGNVGERRRGPGFLRAPHRYRFRQWRGCRGRTIEERQGRWIQDLARPQLLQLVENSALGVGAAEFSGPKFAGGEIERGQAYGAGSPRQRRQKVVVFG